MKHLLLITLLLFSITAGTSSDALSAEDTQPPGIELDDLFNGKRVYTASIYISGHVSDAGNIDTLTINKTPVQRPAGRSFYFSHLAELKEGRNTVTIKADDESGNTVSNDFLVYRETPPLSHLPEEIFKRRMRLAVYPFDQKGTVSEQSSIFMDLFTMALQDQNRFQLIERDRMARVLEEQQLSLTHLINKNAAINIGKLMSAQAIVTGSIIETAGGIEITARMIDTETSQILATERAYHSTGGLAALNFLAEAMAIKLHNDFPMLEGIVVKHKGRQIITSLGQGKAGINKSLIIYRSSEDRGIAILGRARITQVLKDMSKAELIKGSPDDIKVLDRVIVQ